MINVPLVTDAQRGTQKGISENKNDNFARLKSLMIKDA